jgi:hypothetical protein
VHDYVRRKSGIETAPKEITSVEDKNKNSFPVLIMKKGTLAKECSC